MRRTLATTLCAALLAASPSRLLTSALALGLAACRAAEAPARGGPEVAPPVRLLLTVGGVT